MHLKRLNIPKFWPIPKKGTKYVAVPTHNQKNAVPLVIIMRDVLGLVKNKKELKKVLNEKLIKINNRVVKETNYPVSIFDIIKIEKQNKIYRATLSPYNKLILEEISEDEAKFKIYKVINKTSLKKGKTQLNLMFGKNILSEEKVNVGDSVLINLENNKIEKILPLEKGREILVIKGKHAGKKGKIKDIIIQGNKKIAEIECFDNKKIKVWVKNLIVTK